MEDPNYLRQIDVPDQGTGAAQFVFTIPRLRNLTRLRAIRFTATVAAARERVMIWIRPRGRPNTECWVAPVCLTNSVAGPEQCTACVGGPPFVERVVTAAGTLVREDIPGSHLVALPDVWFDQDIIVQLDTDPTTGQALFQNVRVQVEDIDIQALPVSMAAQIPG